MSKVYTTFKDITPEQNNAWEARYGKPNILDLTVEVDDKTYNYVIRKPDRAVLEAMGEHAVNRSITKTNNTLIKNCVLGGDMEAIDTDGQVYVELLDQLNQLKSKAKSTIKKR